MSSSNAVTVSEAIAREVEVVAKATRRRFSAEYKLKILRAAEACTKPGEMGALLRREGLYASNITTWRVQQRTGALAGLAQKKRGERLPWGRIFVRQAKPGKGGSHVERGWKPFDGTQQVPTPARQRKGIQPEASLAWWRGNPSCEA